ncbi:MAG TPA: hypothetical protein VFV60_06230 [bacterium]|nr:hypothetical protein [bacterium]
MSIPVVAITIGNPAGIGPEIVVRTLAQETVRQSVRALVATAPIYEEALWRAGYRHLGNTES